MLPEFWATIYGEQAGVLALFSGVRAGGRVTQTGETFMRWPEQAAAAAQAVSRLAAQGRDVYHCAHLLTQPRRRKAHAAALASLYVDLDHDQLRQELPVPSLTVASSPGKLQCYWRLSSSVPPAAGEAVNRRLAYALGGDRTGWDLTQLLRVPGTINHKYAEQPVVRILSESGRTYEFAKLIEQLPELPSSARADNAPDALLVPDTGAAGEPPVPLSSAARRVWDGLTARRKDDGTVDRSASLVQIARVLFEAGLSRPGIVGALAERDASLGWDKYTGRRDAEDQYNRVVDVVERGSRTRHPRSL